MNHKTILYFGIYKSDFSRNKIYIRGLRALGHTVIECQDSSPGLLKYWRLFRKHAKVAGAYDALIVGYPGHIVVPLARLISTRPVIFDALCTLEEGVIISRGQNGFLGIRALYMKCIDFLAVHSASIILLESHEQKKYFEYKFGKSEKYKVVYTGSDDEVYFKDTNIPKKEKFTVVFRGQFLPEAGVSRIIDAAKILKNNDIDFLIIGNGFLENEIKNMLNVSALNNVQLITRYVGDNELRSMMLSCHVSLGQFENHERLLRTIPHKCFETLALGLPYITKRTLPVSEILEDGKSVIMVAKADADEIAEKILFVKNNPDIAEMIGQSGYEVFQKKLSPKVLAMQIVSIISETTNLQK